MNAQHSNLNVNKLAWDNWKTAPSISPTDNVSPLLKSWVDRVNALQDEGCIDTCGFKVSNYSVARVLYHIKEEAKDGAVIICHYSMFSSETHLSFDRLVDMRFCMCGSDMIMHGTIHGIPVVSVCSTHYQYAYDHHDHDWVAVWYPPVEAQFWRNKRL